MPFGYHGRYLRVDVSRGTGEFVPIDESTLRRFLAAADLACTCAREGAAVRDPLSPEAAICLRV